MGISSTQFNSNLLCSIDIEATGLTPGVHEVVQLAIVPLAPDLTASKYFKAFDLRIRPEAIDVIDIKYKGMKSSLIRDCMVNGMERWSAVAYFREWFEGLKLKPGKKICVLGCNYEAYDLPFLVEFFGGHESYEEFFRSDVRDVQRAALYLNDLAEWRDEAIPFPRYALTNLCHALHVLNHNPHDALSDAVATAEVYRRLMARNQFYEITPTEAFDTKMESFVKAYVSHIKDSNHMSYAKFKDSWIHSFGEIR